MTDHAHAGALSGIRVLDLSRVLAGPSCGEHTDEVLEELLDIDSDSRGELRRKAIID